MFMRNLIFLFFVFFVLSCINSSILNPNSPSILKPNSPCPYIFQYVSLGGNIHGIITLNSSYFENKSEVKIEVRTAQVETLRDSYFGRLALNTERMQFFENIKTQQPINLRLDFPTTTICPWIKYICVNGIAVCSGPEAPLRTTELIYKLTISFEIKPDPKTDLTQAENRIIKPSSENILKQTEKNSWALMYLEKVCGKEDDNNELVVNGKIIPRPRFPWVVAIFEKLRNGNKFECGGSLISARTVLSAAHCFTTSIDTIYADNLFVSLGRHDLNEWENALNYEIYKIIQHPDFKPESGNFNADIAIVLLKNSVSFTSYVKPICLWKGSTDVREIENIDGVVMGWGEYEIHNRTRLLNAAVVPDIECVRWKHQLLDLSTNKTFCAVNKNDNGPCIGDSGSSFTILQENRWTIRGVVTNSITIPNSNCNLEKYTLYSDIAKYLNWINLNMLL